MTPAAAALRSSPSATPARRPWAAPALVELPPLEQLTLQTGAIEGECTPDGGCTFTLLPRVDGSARLPG